MAGYIDGNERTFTAGGALTQHVRVKLSSGKLAVAGITDGPAAELGTVEMAAFADGDVVPVRLRTAAGTRKMIAAGAISLGAPVYTAANGKVSATAASTSYLRGIALEAASGDGAVIEVLDVWPIAQES